MQRVMTFVLGIMVGVIAGAGAMLLAFPFLFPPPPANDPVPVAAMAIDDAAPADAPRDLSIFVFDQTAPGRDAIHWANGSGRILDAAGERVLRLEPDFEAGPGPNYWVYLNMRAVGDETDFNADAGRIKLAPLRAFVGAQNYTLPPEVDLSSIHTVTIWCETFGVYIGSGVLAAQ